MVAYTQEKHEHPAMPDQTQSDDAVPDADPTDTAGILLERLQAWKHACGYLEDYITATEKLQKTHAKEYEKVLKTISDPLKQGHHFDQSLGGIAGLFENMRSNTQGIANTHLETSKNIAGSVLPILARLHTEIKHKNKELVNGASKGAKTVAAARNSTQEYIELLGQHSGVFDSTGGKVESSHDPYLLQRNIQHRLHKQVLEENNTRQDLIAVQDSFQSFESHVIQTIQQAMGAFLQYVGGQADRQKGMYTDIVATTQRIPLEFEWMNFLLRNGNLMIDPSSPKRTMDHITYPNQQHRATKPLLSGTLERKSRAMAGLTGYKTSYYAVTPSKYIHQFEDDDNFRKEPSPDLSLYLPDCTIGALSGEKFNVKGKDVSKGKVGKAFQMTHEFSFKAHTPLDAQKWWSIIAEAAGQTNLSGEAPSEPSSPVNTRNVSGPPAYEERTTRPLQTQRLPQPQNQPSAQPQSATASAISPSGAIPIREPQPHSAGPHTAGLPVTGILSAGSQTTSRLRETAAAPAYSTKYQLEDGRRGHGSHISISDDNHHVTEAIGDLYGDQNYGKRDSRPLSFLPSSPLNESQQPQAIVSATMDSSRSFAARAPLARNGSIENGTKTNQANGQGYALPVRSNSNGRDNGQLSPPLPLGVRSPSDTANSSFPLNDIDYESNPAAVAQELSNLQALRRMSMDVNAAGDPDLPTFNSSFGMPTVAPTGAADEDDTSRLFWVPARLHPELAPKEFKTFLDSRVDSIKRRSVDFSLSPDGPSRQGSGGSGLRRKKSMLSRQIDNSEGKGAEGYQDGAERLDRKRSLSGQEALKTGMSNLQELEVLVNVSDPVQVIQRLSLDTGQSAVSREVPDDEDLPILPAAPPGKALRRSTRTTYRRGSLRKGERLPLGKRIPKSAETDTDEMSNASPVTPVSKSLDDSFDLARVRTEPSPTTDKSLENFSRPGRTNKNRLISPRPSPATPLDDTYSTYSPKEPEISPRLPNEQTTPTTPPVPVVPRHFVSQIASNGRSTVQPPIYPKTPLTIQQPGRSNTQAVPQIIETPPPIDDLRTAPPPVPKSHLLDRTSSHGRPASPSHPGPPQGGLPSPRGAKRPGLVRQNQSEKGNQTLRDMAAHPSPLPGSSTRTDSLSFIPTLPEEKKAESKKQATKKETAEGERKSSWGWGLFGSEEKERQKRKEEEAKEAAKKTKAKQAKPTDKSHDSGRLDVLQTTMDGGRGRESSVLDRGDFKLEEERKKESSRKASGGESKGKGLFSFFGDKKKNQSEPFGKKLSNRSLSPDPPHPVLKPDVDYNWTRFSILEERAIYRMAHIKLANPRRALYSQVLLSNFMYSYLAKVQQMHPQIQLPQATVQKTQERQKQEQQKKKAEQPEEYSQYQKYHEVQQQQEHGPGHTPTQSNASEGPSYIEDNHQNYNHYDRGEPDGAQRPHSRASQHSSHSSHSSHNRGHNNGHYGLNGGGHHQSGTSSQHSPYRYQQNQFDDPGRTADDDMW